MLNNAKRTVQFAIGVFLALTLVSPALAAPTHAVPTHKASFVVGQASYTVDNQVKQMDAKTFIENSRTYVPVRYLAYALGVEDKNIVWNSEQGQVSLTIVEKETKTVGNRTIVIKHETVVMLQMGWDMLLSNRTELNRRMDVTPVIRDGRTYLPARWVAEAFGYKLDWLPESQTVLVYPPGEGQQK